MLTAFLKSVGDEYKIEFRTDIERQWLIVKITRGFMVREEVIPFEFLSNELYIVRVIRDVVEQVESDWGKAHDG